MTSRVGNPGPGPAVAVLTAAGRGAVAAVRVWGPGAVAAASGTFCPHRGRPLAETEPGRPRVGRVGAGLGDEVVAVVLGPDEVEVQCHGGSAAVALVVGALVDRGATPRPPLAWARHAHPSPFRARAAIAAGAAATVRAAEILLDQADGALDRELAGLMGLDDGALRAALDGLVGRSAVGVRLVGGWRVALAGRPNVGKSRLLNALAGFDRAIVDPTPGTTRDAVAARVALEGWPAELVDTAGLRAGADPIEAEGVRRARSIQRGADLVVVVLDRSEPLGPADRAILADHPAALVVANKVDRPAAWGADAVGSVPVSAERGDGIDELVARIAARLVPDPPPPGSGMAVAPSHARWLRSLRGWLDRGGDPGRVRRSLGRWVGGASLGAGGGSARARIGVS